MILEKESKNIENNILTTKKRRFIRRFLQFLIALMLLSAIFTYSLINSYNFRHFVIQKIIPFANDYIEAKFEIDDLNFNMKGELSIINPLLFIKQDTIVFGKQLSLSIDLNSILKDEIIIKKIFIDSCIFNLNKDKNNILNVSKIIAPSEKVKKSNKTGITLVVNQLLLKNSRFTYFDSTKKIKNFKHTIDYSHIDVNNLNLNAKAILNLQDMNFDIFINDLNCYEKKSDYKLDHLDAKINLDSKGIKLKEFNYLSPNADISMTAEINKSLLVLDSNKTFLNADYNVKLNSKKFDFKEVKHFANFKFHVYTPSKMNFSIKGRLDSIISCSGNIETGKILFKFENSRLHNIISDDFSKNFRYEGDYKLNVTKEQMQESFRFMDFSILPELGKVFLSADNVAGSIQAVSADIDLKTTNGNIKGFAKLNYDKFDDYDINLTASNINLNKILAINNISNDISGQINITGNSVDLSKITADADIRISKSKIYGVGIENIIFKADTENGIYNIDSLFVSLIGNNKAMEFFTKAKINYQNSKKPKYNLFSNFDNFNLNYLLNNKSLPTNIISSLHLEGEGIDIDSINTHLQMNFDELSFDDKSLFPFDIDVSLEKKSDSIRSFNLNSEFADFKLEGDFKFNDLYVVQDQIITYFTKHINNYIQSFNIANSKQLGNRKLTNINKIKKHYKDDEIIFPYTNCRAYIKVKDISAFSTFWQGKRIEIATEIDMKINSGKNNFELKTKQFLINKIRFEDDKTNIQTDNIDLNIKSKILSDSNIISLKESTFSLESPINILLNNENIIIKKFTNSFVNKVLKNKYKIIYKDVQSCLAGSCTFNNEKIKYACDTFNISLDKEFDWHTKKDFELSYAKGKKIEIKNFSMFGKSGGKLKLNSIIKDTIISKFNLTVDSLFVNNFRNLFGKKERKIIDNLQLGINKLSISANGKLTSPNINLIFKTDTIVSYNQKAGIISGELTFRNKQIIGNILWGQKADSIVKVVINKLPIDLFISSSKDIVSNKEIDLEISMSNYDLSLLSPYLPVIKNLKGTMNFNAEINGDFPDNLDYSANLDYNDMRFVLLATNVAYASNASILIDKEKIKINKLLVRNQNNKQGKLELTGILNLNDKIDANFIQKFDLKMKAKNFAVLSKASQIALPNIYGNMLISTYPEVKITGNLEYPIIKGGIALEKTNLKMPVITGTKNSESKLQYVVSQNGKHVNIKYIDSDSSQIIIRKRGKPIGYQNNNIFKNMEIDLDFVINSKSSLSMGLGPVGDMYIEVNERDNKKLDFTKKVGEELGKIYGNIVLSENSKLNTFRVLDVSGIIEFPTANPIEPSLNIKAVHKGKTTIATVKKNYEVIIDLSGQVDKLESNIYYSIQGEKPNVDKAKMQEEALLLLITGQLMDTKQEGAESNSNILNESGTALISAFASKSLTSLLNSSYITNAGVDFKGEAFEEATITLTGQLPGDITWSFGGDISDINGNREITIEIPFYSIIKNENLRNIFLQAAWNENSQNIDINNDETDWELKLKFNKSW